MDKKVERVWVDLETTGLSTEFDVPLELGIVLTDKWGGVIAEESWLIWEGTTHWKLAMDNAVVTEVVNKMHLKSKLWTDLNTKETVTCRQAEEYALNFLDNNNVKHGDLPMCGSSIGFDRSFLSVYMPNLERNFHYRNIDVSTLKLLCMDLNPEMYAKMDSHYPNPLKMHRVIPDCYDTIAEYKFYVENFLWVGEDQHA